MISRHHSNRKAHNWLIYDINDRFLARFKNLYRGVLYDLGSGESPYRDFFLQYCDRYVAVDWSASSHKIAADLIADLNRPLPVQAGAADTVVSLSVLEHLQEPAVMLGEANRLLKAGGAIILQVPWQWHIHEAPHDYCRFTPFQLERLLRQAGFTDIVIEPTGGFFTTMALKWNYFTRRYVVGPGPIRALLLVLLGVMWFIGQIVAPVLDRLDRKPSLEAPGFYATARKP